MQNNEGPIIKVSVYHAKDLFFSFLRSAYGSSQAGGQIGAAAASLHHGHNNVRSVTY